MRFERIRQFQQRLSALAEICEEVAPAVVEAVRAGVQDCVSSQTAPDGTPWEPPIEGSDALRGAAGNLIAKIVSRADSVLLLISPGFPDVLHQSGNARGRKVRQFLPGKESELPPEVTAVFGSAVRKAFEKRMTP